jgi:hypothetical protein
MRFGRVEGVAEPTASGRFHLRVILETAEAVTVVRDAIVPALLDTEEVSGSSWQVDQYTQETIGVDLAEQGWEVIGASDLPVADLGEVVRSASYAVRQL